MSKITLIKEPGILQEGIMKVLQDKLPKHIIRVYSFAQYDFLKGHDETDLLIIDLDEGMDIFKLVDFYSNQTIKIVVWISDVENDHITELFKLGLHGYFYNGMETSEIIFAIKYMLCRGQYIHPHLSHVLLNEYIRIDGKDFNRPNGVLTEREWQVLEQVAKGKSNETIAKDLFISTMTVNNHVRAIYRKLDVKDRTNAALLAIKNNWCAP